MDKNYISCTCAPYNFKDRKSSNLRKFQWICVETQSMELSLSGDGHSKFKIDWNFIYKR